VQHGRENGAGCSRARRRLLAAAAGAIGVGGVGILSAAVVAPAGTPREAGLRPRAGSAYRAVDTAYRFLAMRDGRTVERGRETASYQFHGDGLIGVRIHSESDSPAVVRDAIYTLDARWRPLECLLRIQSDGHHEGSGWFRFSPDEATFEGWNASTGRVSQRIPLRSPATALVAHPVTTDAMLAAAYDHDRGGPTMQRPAGVYLSSTDPYGRTGPMLAPSDVFLDYGGRETVPTPAGPADADRYLLHLAEGGQPAAEPLQELWCVPGTTLLLRARARGAYRTTYELTRWEAR
jgi:hypothetical protein